MAIAGCQGRGPTERVLGTAPGGRGNHAAVEFVTGVVTLREGDSITVHVLNFSDGNQPCEIEIYRDTREGAKEVGQNDAYKVRSRGVASSRFTVKNPGEYWVLVKGETSLLAPQATFASAKANDSTVVFKPGDFLKAQAPRAPSYGPPTTESATRRPTEAVKVTERVPATLKKEEKE
jgi:hypothetical protein